MMWTDSAPISDEDSLELLEERRRTCKALIALHASELQRWEGLKARVETAIQMKSLKNQIAKTPKPAVAEADLLDHYKKLVDATGKPAARPEAKAESKEVKVETKTELTEKSSDAKTPARAPASKPAESAAKPAEPAAKPAEPAAKPAEPAAKPAEPAKSAEPSSKSAEPAAKPTEPATKPTEPAAKPAEPAAKPAEPAAESAAKPAEPQSTLAETVAKPAESPAEPSKPAEPAAKSTEPAEEPAVKPAETAGSEAKPTSEPAKATEETKAANSLQQPDEPEERYSISGDEPTNLGSLGSKPKMRGSTSRAPPTMKKDPLVFAPTVVAPSQAEMEEMEKKRAAEEAKSPSDKPKKVQPMGFNPLVGMKLASGPAVKYDKCSDCSCNDFSPDTFKKGKCTNCFHIHPVSKDAPASPAATPASPTPASPLNLGAADDSDEEQPPPPTTPFPGVPKTPDAQSSNGEPKSPDASKPNDDSLKSPTGETGASTPNSKKIVGAKMGFNLGLTPAEVSSEPVVKCKECGCDDFSPDSFKKTKCSNCFHVHAGAPPPPKTGGPKPEEPTADATPKCKDCGCGNFKADPFKKSKCSNCFHNHV